VPVRATRTRLMELLALFATFTAHAPAHAQKDECASLLFAIGMQQSIIDEARRVLAPDEANCAFVDVTMPVSNDCARLKAAADVDVKKRQAWTSAIIAWNQLEQLRLQLRRVEDRRGSTCTGR
jgi:hypothetical protein